LKNTVTSLALLLSVASLMAPAARAEDQPPAEMMTIDSEDPPPAPLPFPEPDWSLLDTGGTMSEKLAPKKPSQPAYSGNSASWSAQDKSNGAAALSVKQSIVPFWDARVGADMNVVNNPSVMTTSDLLRQKYATDSQPSQSNGTAWAAVTAPGVGSIWDRTAIEARIDPSQDQSKLRTSLSKSLPLWSQQYLLTLQNGYNVIQQNVVPSLTLNGRVPRNYETDQQAKLSIVDTGTSFIAGQSLSSTDDKWLRKVGAEQKIFGDVNIAASISETLQGPVNKSLTAGFKHSW
jgi:hypothetical protein